MRLLRTQTDADTYLVETLTRDLMRWLRDEGRPTEGVEVLAVVPLLSTGDAAEYGVVLYRDADGTARLWTARQFEDPWSAETALEVLEKRAAGYRQKAAQTLEFVALAKRELPGQNGMSDAEKVALVEAVYAQHKGTPLRDTITTTDIARALGRDDKERAALAEAFKAADRDKDLWLECANIWIAHCKVWKRERETPETRHLCTACMTEGEGSAPKACPACGARNAWFIATDHGGRPLREVLMDTFSDYQVPPDALPSRTDLDDLEEATKAVKANRAKRRKREDRE